MILIKKVFYLKYDFFLFFIEIYYSLRQKNAQNNVQNKGSLRLDFI